MRRKNHLALLGMGCLRDISSVAPSQCAPFTPASLHVIPSGTQTKMRDWIALGVLNGLLVALSHLIFSLYLCLGPLVYVMGLFHQSMENLFLASIYMLMAFIAPRRRPFTLNATVWSVMGLMQGWWALLPVALPAGFLTDAVIRRAVPRQRLGLVLLGFAFYSTMLSAGNFWPYLFLKHGTMVQRLAAMDPGAGAMVEMFTMPFFTVVLCLSFLTALLGGAVALKLIARFFAPEETAS